METLKLNLKFLILAIALALVSACATNNIKYNDNGYSVANIHKSLNDVYNESQELIESGQAPSLVGESYAMNTNQKSDTKALILAVNDNDPNAFIEVVMKKTSQDMTRLSVKYGKQGNPHKSAIFINLIKEK